MCRVGSPMSNFRGKLGKLSWEPGWWFINQQRNAWCAVHWVDANEALAPEPAQLPHKVGNVTLPLRVASYRGWCKKTTTSRRPTQSPLKKPDNLKQKSKWEPMPPMEKLQYQNMTPVYVWVGCSKIYGLRQNIMFTIHFTKFSRVL